MQLLNFPYSSFVASITIRILLCYNSNVGAQGQLTITSLPDLFFNTGSQSIVQGSVVLLYCNVNSTSLNLIATWSKDGDPLFNDLPHIHIRSSRFNDFTTILLTVVDFQPSDGGSYQCSAEELVDTAIGTTANLIGTKYCRK